MIEVKKNSFFLNEEVNTFLKNIIKNKSLANGYIFYGAEGLGKKQTALQFIKEIFKQSSTSENVEERITNNNHPDFLILRHPNSGAAEMLSKHVECSIINAGDGRHEHPTQALLDAAVIKEEGINLEGLKIAICGDILNSRVARSNIYLLTTMGAQVSVIGPPTLIPKDIERMGVKVFFDLDSGLKSSDIIMILRLQNERMDGSETPSKREYYSFFGINENNLKLAKKNALVMHPGPMNRGVEIASLLADNNEISLVKKQVEMGVSVRIACLEMLKLSRNKLLK